MDPATAERELTHLVRGRAPASESNSGIGAPFVSLAPAALSGPYHSWCGSWQSADRAEHFYGCDVQSIDLARGADWWVSDEFQLSGVSDDRCVWCWSQARLTHLWALMTYTQNNQLVKWSPGAQQNETDSCATVSVTVNSPVTNLSYSQQEPECADNFGPYWIDGLHFGTVWNGHEPDAGWWEHTEGVDMFHSPPNACSDCATMRRWISWW